MLRKKLNQSKSTELHPHLNTLLLHQLNMDPLQHHTLHSHHLLHLTLHQLVPQHIHHIPLQQTMEAFFHNKHPRNTGLNL